MSCKNSVPVGVLCPLCGYAHTAAKQAIGTMVIWCVVIGLVAFGGYLAYRHFTGGNPYGDYRWESGW